MIEQFFVLHLPDYVCPPTVTANKLYFGSKDDLTEYLNNKDYRRGLALDEKLLEAFLKDTKQKIAYNSYQLGEKALVLGDETVISPATEWQHMNIWGFPYDMCFDKCLTSVVWMRYKGVYYRCVKPKFLNLSYLNEVTEEYAFLETYWGQPGFFKQNGRWLEASLYVIEKKFDGLLDAMQDMNDFCESTCLEFSNVIEEIFGDG